MNNLTKGIIITLIVVAVGLGYLYLSMVGPLQDAQIGFGLANDLAATKIAGGYNMANVVLFIIFMVILVVGGVYFFGKKKAK